MEYSKVISVTGLGGLYELVGSKADGAIVRSLEDKTSKFVSSRIHNFSHLESIEVFTVRENVSLSDIFLAMEQSSTELPDEKNASAVKQYFEEVYPDLDFDRVYSSDMKKMVKWYKILKQNDVVFADLQQAEEANDGSEVVAEEAAMVSEMPESADGASAETPKKKAAKKNKAEEQ